MRRMTVVLIGLLVVASGCAQGPSGPQTYAVNADAPSPEGKALQVSAFFPGTLTAGPGDTIVFGNRSTEAPHTVTFGVLADRSNQPALLVEGGAENPVAFQACYSEDNATPELAQCPHKDLPAFGGEGYWNSGVLAPAPAPAMAGPKEVKVELTDDIAPGSYAFVCVLHPFMNGTLDIVEEEGDRSEVAELEVTARDAATEAVESGEALEAPELVREGQTLTISAGWGDRVTAVNLYAPATQEVPVGTTVQWLSPSPYEPHTITFESPYQQPADPKSFAPGGVTSGSDYTGGFANSGLIGPEGGPFPAGPFALKFTKAGEYTYLCTLHANMKGVVKVV